MQRFVACLYATVAVLYMCSVSEQMLQNADGARVLGLQQNVAWRPVAHDLCCDVRTPHRVVKASYGGWSSSGSFQGFNERVCSIAAATRSAAGDRASVAGARRMAAVALRTRCHPAAAGAAATIEDAEYNAIHH
jgi:hypothetical protein